jgi:hypothetical protein
MPIPAHPAEITTEWLTDTLRASGMPADTRVRDIQIEPLGGAKGTTGPLARLKLTYQGDSATAPRSLITKFSASDPQSRTLIHGMGFYEREVRFYKELASQSRLHTPHCYYGAVEQDTGLALLLLEDLDATHNGSNLAGCSVMEAELAVRAIANFHAGWWQNPQITETNWLKLRSLVSIEQAPSIFLQAWDPVLGRLGGGVTGELLQVGGWLKQYVAPLYGYLYQESPWTLIHNDYQADNLFFWGEGLSFAVVDWQLTTRGRGALDVASLLGGNLNTQDRRDQEQRLIGLYHNILMDNGVRGYTFERCWDDYRLAMVQPLSRIITVVGIGAASPEVERGYCEVVVPRYCQAALDLHVGAMLDATFSAHVVTNDLTRV